MIKLKNVTKSFPNKTLFNNLSFDINKGEMIAITGSSGSGKSTLLNIISSIEKADSGRISVSNYDIANLKSKKQKYLFKNVYGFVFQNYALVEEKTVAENIMIGNDKVSKNSIEEVLEKVHLTGFGDRIINSLSGGEQQRVAIARVILKDAQIIIADEPTGNLDTVNSTIIMDLFRNLKLEGKTIVVATHDISHLDYFDKIINLDWFLKFRFYKSNTFKE